jgi:hypothetical protein
VVGYNLPSIRVTSADSPKATSSCWPRTGSTPASPTAIAVAGSAQEIAARILERHGKAADDALVVVVR